MIQYHTNRNHNILYIDNHTYQDKVFLASLISEGSYLNHDSWSGQHYSKTQTCIKLLKNGLHLLKHQNNKDHVLYPKLPLFTQP